MFGDFNPKTQPWFFWQRATSGQSLAFDSGQPRLTKWVNNLLDPGTNGLVARVTSFSTQARTISSGSTGALTITNSGGIAGNPVIDFSAIAPSSLWANVSTATNTPVVITLAGNLAFSGTTLTTTNLSTGTVGSIATGTGLTGGTITNTGTIQFAQIAPSSIWANVSTATSTPVVTTLGTGLLFSGSVLTLSGGLISKQYTQATGANQTVGMDTSAVFPYTVGTVRGARTSTGSITAAFQINGTNISGLGAVVITTTAQTVTALATNVVVVGDRLTVVFTTNTSASNIEFTMAATRNG